VANNVLLLAGIGGLVGGALAIGGSEYAKVAGERDRQSSQLARERRLLAMDPEAELAELTGYYVGRGLSPELAGRVAKELTARDALQAHAEMEYGITAASRADPIRDAVAVAVAFAAGAALPLVAMALLPGQLDASVTYLIVVLALAFTGWFSARVSNLPPARSMLRTAGIGVAAMTVTFVAGTLFHP
jgi:VIT1/CCC1 family predicted Fe2+/Mn2+ transporter